MNALSKILGPAIGRDEVLRTARAQLILQDWPEIVGKSLATRSAPDRYDHGTVWVAVEGSAWAQELRLAKPLILKKLYQRCGDAELFKDLRFGVRPFDLVQPRKPELPPPPAKGPDDRTIQEIAAARLKAWVDHDEIQPAQKSGGEDDPSLEEQVEDQPGT